MTIIRIRIRFKQLGGHMHCRVFVGTSDDGTFAKAGDFVLSAGAEWDDFVSMMKIIPNVQIKHEDEA